ncbi:MAG TPA: hypothetical protein VLV83_05810 [Acidobacteriota bacterium]|nr:hypothetical protein [Acidobacteriota bacterium]
MLLVPAQKAPVAESAVQESTVQESAVQESGQPAHGTADDFPVGQAVERVQCLGDENQSYALYLPSGYTPEKQWPLLFALDPRSRGMIPLNLFKEAAERHQFIIMSSNNFMSDTNELESTQEVMIALWNDAIQRFPLDPRRIYVTGFSGGSRIAWVFDHVTKVPFAGIIGVGAGFPWNGSLTEDYENAYMAFFGLVGDTDFNYYDMNGMRPVLEEKGIPHRVVSFPGGHSWAPAEYCSMAMDWMAVRDIKAGRRDKDTALVDGIYQQMLRRAEKLQGEGRLIAARRELESLVSDFEGLLDTAAAAQHLEQLRTSKELTKQEKRRRKEAERVLSVQSRALGLMEWVKTARQEEIPAVTHLRFEMRLPPLLKQSRSNHREERLAAQRALENIFVQCAFYAPRQMSQRGDHRRALIFLDLAHEIKPGNPFVWYRKAVNEAQLGSEGGALKALEKAVENGFNRKDILQTSPQWKDLRDKERFQKLLASMADLE